MTVRSISVARKRREIAAILTGRLRARVVLSLLGAALLAAGMGMSASPASASTAPSAPVVRASGALPAAVNTVTLIFKNNSSHAYPCDGGSTFHTDLPNYVKMAYNNCNVRVWLHTHNNNTGYSGCMSPRHSFTVDDSIKFVNVYVSTNTSNCQY
jgi:hypothetical protein